MSAENCVSGTVKYRVGMIPAEKSIMILELELGLNTLW